MLILDEVLPTEKLPETKYVLEPRVHAFESELAASYLQSLDHGLLLIDRNGRIVVCNEAAMRFIGLLPGGNIVGRRASHVLRYAHVGVSESRAAILNRLRVPLRERRPIGLSLVVDGNVLSLELRPLPDAGWAVTIADPARSTQKGRESDGWRDVLTGLPNRALFGIRLDEAVARLQRTGKAFALLAIDLDRFKQVNDTLGHPVGDELLRKVAERLQTTLRPTDTVARLGGDEFAVLQSEVGDGKDAKTLACRIVDLVGRSYVVDGHLINIGTSVGLALAPDDGVDADKLLKHADLALYDAKLEGRGIFRFFKAEMGARMEARRLLELDLRKAVTLREFELVYQPQLNIATNRLVGC